jgi:hypothetical protein
LAKPFGNEKGIVKVEAYPEFVKSSSMSHVLIWLGEIAIKLN